MQHGSIAALQSAVRAHGVFKHSGHACILRVLCLQVLCQVLSMAAKGLADERYTPESTRITVEASISSLQALISLLDESTPRSGTPTHSSSSAPSKQLQQLALRAEGASVVGHATCACIAAISKLHVRPDHVLQACGVLTALLCCTDAYVFG